ncbi:Fungal Zn binuclear cluster domain containing protein/C6 transcription factor [Blumeria hordei DH14]|uniref:Fungal Zn binuclear cluster domain containing protein/C6 transcription factor n=1 Tax=Blumeria graminis f. sp. hordei (strain DH14) TaxID=546991 RepID=N1JBQ4_BLUG1|nr:Fungal Zn binuclear cluster domain containing protein/C6 transcription factor [Blumeria hordei DH14]
MLPSLVYAQIAGKRDRAKRSLEPPSLLDKTMSIEKYHLPITADSSNDSIASCGSPPAQNGEQNYQPQHKRVYQACIPCRRRKVKCDLGSVDNPSDPPCVRCRRESKECFFSATRRKRKYEDGAEESTNRLESSDEYAIRNGRRPTIISHSPSTPDHLVSLGTSQPKISIESVIDVQTTPRPPMTPGGSIGCTQPLRRPAHNRRDLSQNEGVKDPTAQLENLEAQEVMRQQVYGPYDALDLLYKAATDSSEQSGDRNEYQLPPIIGACRPSQRLSSPSLPNNDPILRSPLTLAPKIQKDSTIDPALFSGKPTSAERTHTPGYKDAIRAWGRFRFVRAGWFTAAEAIEYVNYYYEYLSPLTPISPPTFRDPGTHYTLLTEEPILTVTLLTIATRYRQISDPGGHCRSYAIHEQLWNYLRGMIERCLWGQEAFGGRFCGLGLDAQTSSTAPGRGLRKGSLRTLGTIESLMILTEWHPRALNFPPVDAIDELMIPGSDGREGYAVDEETGPNQSRTVRGIGGKRIESWLEPAWRSDRMCWMLLSTAMGLSYELGVFDNFEELLAENGETTRPEYEEEAYRLRATRIKRLLLICVTQLAGRLGWTNMVPENLRSTDPSFAPMNRKSSNGRSPDICTNISGVFNYIPDSELDDQVIHCWAGITNAMRIGNETLFKTRQYTTKIIQDGSYVELLQEFQPILRAWKIEFELFQLPPYIRHILSIEYEYIRIYVNSLSLQAIVERCTNHAGLHADVQRNNNNNNGTAGVSVLSPETQSYYGKLPLARLGGFSAADQDCVREVVDGSRNLLRIVVEGLLPNNYLKHAPVRTYFRIICGAMFLLKSFALGASKNDVEISIGLMDRSVAALRNCVVDDSHLGIRFADLLETLTSRLRCRFISASTVRASDRNRSSLHQELDPKYRKSEANSPGHDWITGANKVSLENSENNPDLGLSATPYDLNPHDPPSESLIFFNPSDDSRSMNSGDPMHDVFGKVVDWGAGTEVWYLPPGMAFYQQINDQAVAQRAEGVNVGGMDLLDFMALDPPGTFGDAPVF